MDVADIVPPAALPSVSQRRDGINAPMASAYDGLVHRVSHNTNLGTVFKCGTQWPREAWGARHTPLTETTLRPATCLDCCGVAR